MITPVPASHAEYLEGRTVISRLDRALELAERLVEAFERIADALERDTTPQNTPAPEVDKRPANVRGHLTSDVASKVERAFRRKGLG